MTEEYIYQKLDGIFVKSSIHFNIEIDDEHREVWIKSHTNNRTLASLAFKPNMNPAIIIPDAYNVPVWSLQALQKVVIHVGPEVEKWVNEY